MADGGFDGWVPVSAAESVVVGRASVGVGEHQIRPRRILAQLDRQLVAEESGDADGAVTFMDLSGPATIFHEYEDGLARAGFSAIEIVVNYEVGRHHPRHRLSLRTTGAAWNQSTSRELGCLFRSGPGIVTTVKGERPWRAPTRWLTLVNNQPG